MLYKWKVTCAVVSCSAAVHSPLATSGAECLQDHMFVSNGRKNAELGLASTSRVAAVDFQDQLRAQLLSEHLTKSLSGWCA